MKKIVLTLIVVAQAFYSFSQDVEIQGNATITGTLNLMDTIQFADGTALASACLSILQDADGDTKIEVESNPDDDKITLVSNGEVIMVIDQSQFRIIHNGNSLFIGEFAGAKDDGDNENLYIGTRAGDSNSRGRDNTIIGHLAGRSSLEGSGNTYLGKESGQSNEGSNNAFVGAYAGNGSEGQSNVIIGSVAGEGLVGDNNTIIGTNSGEFIQGSGNVLVGPGLAAREKINNKLLIHNNGSQAPLVEGDFGLREFGVTGKLNTSEGLYLLDEDPLAREGINFGFDGDAEMRIAGYQFTHPFISQFNHQRIDFGHVSNGTFNMTMQINSFGNMGIGGLAGLGSKLRVVDADINGPVVRIENTSPGVTGDGLEIKINRPTTGCENNFITFTDSDGIAGRIEGFNILEDQNKLNFPDIDFSDYFDIIQLQLNAFDPGSLPTLSGGQLPSISGGSFPTLNPGQWPSLNPGSLPSLSGGNLGQIGVNASFNINQFVENVACAGNPFCNSYPPFYTFDPTITGFSWPTLNRGSLPSLSGGQLPSLSGGSFPTLNPGQLPNLNPGTLPTIDFDFIFDPTPLAGALDDLQTVLCWALENGAQSSVSANPFDMKLLGSDGYLARLANCKNGGVTYGSGGADYAEYLERAEHNEVMKGGQIVGVKGGKISKNTEGAEQLLVISIQPIVLGNMPDDTAQIELYEKVAFLGQAPVWVVGNVSSGDYIIPSGRNDGYGIAIRPDELSLEQIPLVVGRAWSDGDQILNLVNMIVGLKTNEMASILNRFSDRMNAYGDRLDALEATLYTKELVADKD